MCPWGRVLAGDRDVCLRGEPLLEALVLPGALVNILLSATGSSALLLVGTAPLGARPWGGLAPGGETLVRPGPWGRDPGAARTWRGNC